MLKKNVLGNASAANLEEAFKCGDCLHHKTSCHPSYEKPCSQLGIKTFALAPKCFTPDYTKVIPNAEQFVVLSALFNDLKPAQARILIAVLRQAGKAAKKNPNLPFGTKVYFKTGADVLKSYLCGYVVGYTSSGELVLTGSSDRRSAGSAFFAYLLPSTTLLTPKAWKEKKKELIAAGLITSKKQKVTPAFIDKYTDYEVPTIDSNPGYFDREQKKRKSKRSTPVDEFMVS